MLLSMAVAGPIAVAAALGMVVHLLDPAAAALVLVLVIVVVSLRGDWVANLLAVVASAVSFDYFLTAPRRSLKIHDSGDIQVTVALVLVGAAIGAVSWWARSRDAAAQVRGEYLAEAARVGQGGLSRARVAGQVADLLGADAGVWVEGEPRSGDAVVAAPDRLVLASSTINPVRVGLPTDAFICFPAGQGYVRVSAASRSIRPALDQMRAATVLAAQLRG